MDRNWPETVEEAAHEVLRGLGDGQSRLLSEYKENDLALLHFGLGQGIRNDFGLWHGNTALLKSCAEFAEEGGLPEVGWGMMDADSASNLIIRRAWEMARAEAGCGRGRPDAAEN